MAAQALAASPRSPLAHFAKGQVLRAQGRLEDAIPEYEAAIAFNRNWLHAISALGECKLYTGSTEEAILLQEQAIRLSPRDPLVGAFYQRIGIAHLLQSRTDEAIPWFKKARGALSGTFGCARLARLRLCPQRRHRTRCCGTRGGLQAEH